MSRNLKKRFEDVFTEEEWKKLEKTIEELKKKFLYEIYLDDDMYDFVINE